MVSTSISPIIAVGTIGIDTINSPFGKAEHVLGGSAMYFAAAASLLAPVNVVSVVGEDFGPERWKEMAHPEVDLSGVATLPGKTFRWGGQYQKDINRRDTLFTELGVLERFNPVLPESYRSCRTVFLANVDPAVQIKVLDSVLEPGFVVLDTMNY
ncbi:MAG: sugar kinase, partial [Candidatus Glassbacteria bacterium]|nr:sugar kinase [Candidatus Glassbacteria bacterium]